MERRRSSGKLFSFRVFGRRGVYRPEGGAGSAPGGPGTLPARPDVGPCQVAAWTPCGPPLVALLRAFVILLKNILRRFSGNLEVFFFSNSASTFYRSILRLLLRHRKVANCVK